MDDPFDWDPDAVRRKVEADPEHVRHRDKYGHTPLTGAADFGDDGLAAFLLEHGADPNAETADGYSPLLSAVESEAEGSAAVLARLLAAGADHRRHGFNGWTPLHLAACRGYVEKCRILLDAGAEIDRRATVDDYRTPLMEAASAGRADIVRLLLDRGADASLREEMFGETAREIALKAGRGCDPEVYAYLKANPIKLDPDAILADVDPEIDEAVRSHMRALLANHDAAESYREAADGLAAEGRHAEVVRMLDERAARRGWRRWFRRGGK